MRISIFQTARIRLTVWYLLILTLVTMIFSASMYQLITTELDNRFQTIERRLISNNQGVIIRPLHRTIFDEGLAAARRSVLVRLIYANGFILLISGTASWLLAGKSLKPIEEALDEQRRFVADASHELKTPLTALQTSIEVALRDKRLKLKDAKTTLNESLDDIENLKSLTENLLSLARGQQSGIELENLSLKTVIQNAIKTARPLALKKKVKISSKLANVNVEGNSANLEKLFLILLDNAIKYSPRRGKVSVILSKARRSATIKITDSGQGISKNDLPHIFDRFYRADLSRSKKTEGFGLGLTLAKQIVDTHNGNISIKSKVGSGTTFTISLPL